MATALAVISLLVALVPMIFWLMKREAKAQGSEYIERDDHESEETAVTGSTGDVDRLTARLLDEAERADRHRGQ